MIVLLSSSYRRWSLDHWNTYWNVNSVFWWVAINISVVTNWGAKTYENHIYIMYAQLLIWYIFEFYLLLRLFGHSWKFARYLTRKFHIFMFRNDTEIFHYIQLKHNNGTWNSLKMSKSKHRTRFNKKFLAYKSTRHNFCVAVYF